MAAVVVAARRQRLDLGAPTANIGGSEIGMERGAATVSGRCVFGSFLSEAQCSAMRTASRTESGRNMKKFMVEVAGVIQQLRVEKD